MSELIIFHRAFPAVIQQVNARQLTGRLVPYNIPTEVLDIEDNKFDLYKEGFRPGAFAPQLDAASNKGVIRKIGLIHRHEGGLGYLGPFVALREQPDGLYGDVNILPTKADDVGALLSDGIDELSIEFHLVGKSNNTTVDAAGVRWRTKAYLHQVALEPKGAYSQAHVLAYRAEAEEQQREQAEAEAEQAEQADEEARKREAEEEERRIAAVEETAREQAEDVERQRAEMDAELAMERKRRWEELTKRVDPATQQQAELVRLYGIPERR